MKMKTIGEYTRTHSQLITSESLSVNMTQKIEMRTIGKIIELERSL